ncbi:hypothetical protein [Altererythrobacter sp. ZODW24]|uniref:hypothetical protein n=1 Tax=Altererythrobacter sp. ZODW24 TaxID=2185142 RepID=UPI000DF74F7C|nr:hypothetical protein [Altererythrobacter sp. ZODW24]
MQKVAVFFIAMIGSFVAVVGFSPEGKQAITEEMNNSDAMKPRCIRQVEQVAPNPARAPQICDCMTAEFDSRGLSLVDAFGDDFDEMQRVTQSCVQLYSN